MTGEDKKMTDHERLMTAQPHIQEALKTLHPVEVLFVLAKSVGWQVRLNDTLGQIEGMVAGTPEFLEIVEWEFGTLKSPEDTTSES